MRNEPQPLTLSQDLRVSDLRDILSESTNDVTLHYIKRDGTPSKSTGLVHGFNGQEGYDTESVQVITAEKGIRTINMVRVTAVIVNV